MHRKFGTKEFARAGLLAALWLLPTLAWSEDQTVVMGKSAFNIKDFCGTKPTIVGLSDGFGGDTWRRTTLAELKDEASKCPNIVKVLYTDGLGDPQKTNADINSLVAQGTNVLILFPDFGPAQFPAMRAALKAGVAVIPHDLPVDGAPGTDFTANPHVDLDVTVKKWLAFLNQGLKKGNILYFSGTPGNAFSTKVMAAIKRGLANYPDLKLLDENFVVTNWNPADAQKAAVGAIAKYPHIDAVFTDYGPVALAVIRTFQQAGVKVPYMAGFSGNNELNCMWLTAKKNGAAWPFLSLEGTTTVVRNALRRGMAQYQNIPISEPLGLEQYIYADSLNGVDPKCDASAPPDADLSGLLSVEQFKAVFKH